MIITKKFSYNGKFHCDALLFRGTAVGVNKSRTVHTKISGGGGSIHTGIDGKVYGGTSKIHSTTETYIHDEFFLRNQTSGKEKDFSLDLFPNQAKAYVFWNLYPCPHPSPPPRGREPFCGRFK